MTQNELIIELSKIPSFVGSVAYNYANTEYMKEKDVEKELFRRWEQIDRIKHIKGCGGLTRNEKKELVLLEKYFQFRYKF